MAEGGIAAAMGNRWPEDNWEVHFRDTMRGGKMLNNWRMAQLHAQEAPERVLELEDWGALFDRTEDGLISQRDFGGHRYARLAHVGDRTGLEMIRTLQQRAVALGIDVFMECTVTELLKDGGRRRSPAPSATGARPAASSSSRRRRSSWRPAASASRSRSPRTPGSTPATGTRSRCGPAPSLINMEFVQFHPTGMVWPPSVKGLLVTESVRGDGGILRNSEGKRFMFDYIPEFFKSETADTEEEADRWYDDKKNNRRPPELLPRDEVARAINSEIKAGRGSPHGGIFLDIASRRTPEFIRKRLPSMYHQFKELADVDITAEPMEIGPTCHYVMGGVEVDPDTEQSAVTGLYAVGECSGGMHGSNRLGGNSLVRPAGLRQAGRRGGGGVRARRSAAARRRGRRRQAVRGAAQRRSRRSAPFDAARARREPVHDPAGPAADDERPGRHHPHRRRSSSSRWRRSRSSRSAPSTSSVEGHRQYNPGWHLAIDLRNMLLVSECIAQGGAGARRSRAAATPATTSRTDAEWGSKNLVADAQRRRRPASTCAEKPLPVMPDELKTFFEDEVIGSGPDGLRPEDAGLARRRGRRRAAGLHRRGRPRARSSSTPSTGCRPPRPATSRCAGTARPASAARAAPRSTAGRGCCA